MTYLCQSQDDRKPNLLAREIEKAKGKKREKGGRRERPKVKGEISYTNFLPAQLCFHWRWS